MKKILYTIFSLILLFAHTVQARPYNAIVALAWREDMPNAKKIILRDQLKKIGMNLVETDGSLYERISEPHTQWRVAPFWLRDRDWETIAL